MLYDGKYLEGDLERLRASPASAQDTDLIDVFITQVAESDEAVWTLTQWPGENANPLFNVKGIECLHKGGYNCYRLRPLTRRLNQYRILYAYDAPNDNFHILAVVRKRPDVLPAGSSQGDFYNYERDHTITRRICDEYDALGLPKLC